MSEIDIQDALERLKQEFIDTSAEKLNKIDRIIDKPFRGKEDDRGAEYVKFQRDIHSLKGSTDTYCFDSVSLIAHRLEYYIETTRQLTSEHLLDVQKYIDQIQDILEGGDEIAAERLSGILESLPTSADTLKNRRERCCVARYDKGRAT